MDLSETWEAEQLVLRLVELTCDPTLQAKASGSEVSIGLQFRMLAITEEEMIDVIRRGMGSTVSSLFPQMRSKIYITERVLIAIAAWQPDETLDSLLKKGTNDLHVTSAVIQAAGAGRSYTKEGMASLMQLINNTQKEKDDLCVESILIVAARNKYAKTYCNYCSNTTHTFQKSPTQC